jgi:hypothetical protein
MTPNVMGSLRIIVFRYSITVFLLVKRLLSKRIFDNYRVCLTIAADVSVGSMALIKSAI